MKPERIAYIKQQIAAEFARNEAHGYPEGFPPLPDIPLARYTDPRFFELEKKHLWRRHHGQIGLLHVAHPSFGLEGLRGMQGQAAALRHLPAHGGGRLPNKPAQEADQ